MIPILVGLACGAVTAAVLERTTVAMFDTPVLLRENYRNAVIPTAVGLLIAVTLFAFGALAVLWQSGVRTTKDWSVTVMTTVGPTLLAATAFSLLGLVDDVAGVGQSGGFKGHLGDLKKGRVGSGMMKLLGGAGAAIVVASLLAPGGATWWMLLRDGATIALGANLGNLLDRAPGRTLKATSLWFVVVATATRDHALVAPAVGIGAGLGLLRGDLAERYMVGDAGSNVVGALCGVMMVVVTEPRGVQRWALLAVLFGLNLVSEVVSFSKVIDGIGPLRWLDRLGSRRPR